MERKRLIRITKNQIYLTPDVRLSLSQTSLKGTDISFRSVQDIYLEIEVIEYKKNDNSINVRVVDYEPKNVEKFKDQYAKSQVSFIKFEPLSWKNIEVHLSSYTKSKLEREKIVFNDGSSVVSEKKFEKLVENLTKQPAIETPRINTLNNTFKQFSPREPIIETIYETGKIYFKDADFNLGFVSFCYKSKHLDETFNLKIENYFILTEFNSVKSYFPKAFGGKKQFNINVTFTLKDKVVTEIVTTSLEIAAINDTILESIKGERIAKLTSTPLRNSIDKTLFTSDDIFDSFDDNINDGNLFNQTEEDILNYLIGTRVVRNAKHLQFLAGSKHSTKQKLRFTLKPLFGFLFFIEGETKNHFCWELLDSHATYLWSFTKHDSDIKYQFKRIEETINLIRFKGREAYKHDYKTNNIDFDLTFCTIEHSDINSAIKESFVEWHHRLKERLV
jgi:hypothetical protein